MDVVDIAAEAAILALALVSIGALAWRSEQDDRDRPRKPRPEGSAAGDIATPVIVDENGELALYDSVAAAERSCEAIDVWNQEYVAYDARGRRLSLNVDDQGLVWMGSAEDPTSVENAVCEDLRRYIRGYQPVDGLDDLSLRELLQTARTLGLVSME